MKTLGKYELLDEIASGGMGRIYRARDRVLHREVAIKTIFTAETDPEIKQRFYREARACAALSHPNIVTVFDLGEQQGTSYIAMEHLTGEDLRRFIDRHGVMTLEAKIDFMAQVCEGLAHAHENRIVHRDLKPGNIFILKSGRPKILDFGVARIAASRLTQPGTPLGTPRYMAPEQLLGKEADVLSDLFSLALVFFEFLTEVHPFEGEDVSTKILKEPPQSLLALNPNIPDRLDKIFAKALSKDPGGRFQSGGAFAKELRKVTVDMVGECARLWNDVLNHRKRILELESAAGDFLRTSWMQAALKKSGIDLAVVEKIKAENSATVVSELNYLDLVAFLDEIRRTEMVLARVSDEAIKSRQDAEEANLLLQKGDLEAASRIVCPLEERFPDHPLMASLVREVRLRSRAKILEEALSSENLVDALEVMNDLESIETANPESVALVKQLRSRVDDALAAKDMLCDSTKATLRQLQSTLNGDDAVKIEKLTSSLAELSQELSRRYAGRKVPKDIDELLSECQKVQKDSSFHIARIRVREGLNTGDLASVRNSMRIAREIGQGDPRYEGWFAKIQREVVDSILCLQAGELPPPLPLGPREASARTPSGDRPGETPVQPETRPKLSSLEEAPMSASWEAKATMVPMSLEAAATMIQPPAMEATATMVQPSAEEAATMVQLPDQSPEGFVNAAAEPAEAAGSQAAPEALDLKVCAACGASSPAASVRCRLCDTPLTDLPATDRNIKSSSVAKVRVAGGTEDTSGRTSGPAQILGAGVRAVVDGFQALPKRYRITAASALALVILSAAAALLFLPRGKPAPAPSVVGSSRISAQSAPLRARAREDAAIAGHLARGTPVEILDKVPEKAMNTWVLVRAQDKRPASGYVRLSELSAVDTGVSDFDLWHVRNLIPDPARADQSELRARLADAESAVARLLKGSEAVNLHLQIAAGHVSLARNALPDRAAAKKDADRAQFFLDQLQSWGAETPEMKVLRVSLDEVVRVPQAPAPSNPAPSDSASRRELERAQKEFDDGEYATAVARCERILKSDRSNQEAANLLKKATAAKQLKEKLLSYPK